MYNLIRTGAVLTLTFIAGCSSGGEEQAAPGTEGAAATAPAAASGEQGMHADTLTPRLQAHMAAVDKAQPGDLPALLPEHRRLVTAMIEECRKMMADMKMQPPAKWTQLEEQLQQDLNQLPLVPPAQLATRLDEHRGRVRQMMEMRHDMMGSM